MNKILFFLLFSIVLFACGESTDKETKKKQEAEDSTVVSPGSVEEEGSTEKSVAMIDPRTHGGAKSEEQLAIEAMMRTLDKQNELVGNWVGDFGKNKINIVIGNITFSNGPEGTVTGFSICAGNYRPISGTVAQIDENKYHFNLQEPGDDQYDGVFDFEIDKSSKKLTGKWKPYVEEGNSSKNYTLSKRNFEYDPSVGKYPEASIRELTDDDLYELSEDELAEMRNEIYARHGYSFKNKTWRYHFEEKEWYMPMGIDIRDQLSDVEVTNIELIYEYESYYDEYYDDYGR